MRFEDYRQQMMLIGRQINAESLTATRSLVTPLHTALPSADIKIVRDIAYGPHERHRLDAFIAGNGGSLSRPLLVFVHGGGFVAGDKHAEGSPFFSNIGQWAVRNGFNAVTITYRLAPAHQWPSGIEDLRLVVDYLQRHGGQHGLDASRLFLMGQSAGAAHVASYIAHAQLYAPKPHGVSGVVLLSGIYDFSTMPPSHMEPAYLGNDRSIYPARASLAGLVSAQVPMMVTLAEFDPPQFELQTLALLTAAQQHTGKLPRFVHALGQNHMSVAMFLGLPGDLVAPQLKAFLEEYGN